MKNRPKSDKSQESMIFSPDWGTASYTVGESVLEIAEKSDLPLMHSCGGMGSCGTCRVIVESDLASLPERNEVEQEIADDRGFAANERLACQLQAFPGLRVRIPDYEE